MDGRLQFCLFVTSLDGTEWCIIVAGLFGRNYVVNWVLQDGCLTLEAIGLGGEISETPILGSRRVLFGLLLQMKALFNIGKHILLQVEVTLASNG